MDESRPVSVMPDKLVGSQACSGTGAGQLLLHLTTETHFQSAGQVRDLDRASQDD